MTDHVRRIQFYTKKAAAYSRTPWHERNKYRFARLMAYKRALNRRLEAAGYR